MNPSIFNWSGGKDSSLTLYHVLKDKSYDVKYLLTTVNAQYQRISMHGVRVDLLEQQAQSLGLPLYKVMIQEVPTMETYNDLMRETLERFIQEGINHSIYGDIFLEDLKQYRENQLAKVGMKAVFPIWQRSTVQLAEEFIDLGFKAIIVCVDERHLDQSFAGREFDQQFLGDLPSAADPCGENGEFHTFVYDGPIFKTPIKVHRGEIVYKTYKKPAAVAAGTNSYQASCEDMNTGFWYCDLT